MKIERSIGLGLGICFILLSLPIYAAKASIAVDDSFFATMQELKQKFEYIINNPSSAGLTDVNRKYEWLYWNEEIVL